MKLGKSPVRQNNEDADKIGRYSRRGEERISIIANMSHQANQCYQGTLKEGGVLKGEPRKRNFGNACVMRASLSPTNVNNLQSGTMNVSPDDHARRRYSRVQLTPGPC